ncbi:MAG TPA: nickel pincer cofactor biosynthesis protein LarC [Bacteroidales bacterium]|nr:nickel pincer cofactor biosynthesis protein LarC [Bacteroidales bacterium]
MKILYFDCFAGISGDMNLGAMIDLGVDPAYLKKELTKIPVHGYDLHIGIEKRKGISGTRVQVVIDNAHEHLDGSHHHHGHDEHEHQHHSYLQIKELIRNSSLHQKVKDISQSIFLRIAEAEAKIHNKTVDEVHFHEVGAIDSIVDIVGAAICIHYLEPDEILCSTVELGGGTVKCAHGIYPVPAPATAEILKNIPVRKGTVDYEATTPTGAAIVAACVNKFTDKTDFTITKTGYGIGSKDATIPNVLRVFLCNTVSDESETVPSFIIECNIDDMNPEFYDYIIDSLFSAGAKDVFITPIIMKKSRPAVKLSVLCTPDAENRVNEVLFRETSTLGVRKCNIDKTMLERKIEQVTTRFGDVSVKSAFYQGVCIKSKPEYEDCIKIARTKGIPVSHVYREVEKELAKKVNLNE